MVMDVKKARFHTMGNDRKGRTENRWAASDAGQSAPPAVYLVISMVSTSRRVRATTDLFVVALQSAVL
jgi:hypothetical protein